MYFLSWLIPSSNITGVLIRRKKEHFDIGKTTSSVDLPELKFLFFIVFSSHFLSHYYAGFFLF